MTEGGPMMNNQAMAEPNTSTTEAAGEAQELVIVYAPKVPPQLEHWLRKRAMRLQVSETRGVDVSEIRAAGAKYVVVDLDVHSGDQGPIDFVRALRAQVPDVRIVVTTARGDDDFLRALSEVGASGIVIKQPYVADLVFAIQAVGEGRSFVSGAATERERAAVQITAREREVLELMANGHSNQAIGERLSISVKTVEAHRARLFKKLGASNVADAVLLAIRTGLVMP